MASPQALTSIRRETLATHQMGPGSSAHCHSRAPLI
jgi:hypothetical protein